MQTEGLLCGGYYQRPGIKNILVLAEPPNLRRLALKKNISNAN